MGLFIKYFYFEISSKHVYYLFIVFFHMIYWLAYHASHRLKTKLIRAFWISAIGMLYVIPKCRLYKFRVFYSHINSLTVYWGHWTLPKLSSESIEMVCGCSSLSCVLVEWMDGWCKLLRTTVSLHRDCSLYEYHQKGKSAISDFQIS